MSYRTQRRLTLAYIIVYIVNEPSDGAEVVPGFRGAAAFPYHRWHFEQPSMRQLRTSGTWFSGVQECLASIPRQISRGIDEAVVGSIGPCTAERKQVNC